MFNYRTIAQYAARIHAGLLFAILGVKMCTKGWYTCLRTNVCVLTPKIAQETRINHLHFDTGRISALHQVLWKFLSSMLAKLLLLGANRRWFSVTLLCDIIKPKFDLDLFLEWLVFWVTSPRSYWGSPATTTTILKIRGISKTVLNKVHPSCLY